MSDSKTRIGISLRIVESTNYLEKRDALSHDWPPLIEKLGALPIFIPNTLTKLEEFLEDVDLDGLILSGGDDVGKNPERDLCEKKIIDFIYKLREETSLIVNKIDYSIREIDILKLDVEGAEKNIFSSNTNWISKVQLLIIELHDEVVPGCSREFFSAISEYDFEVEA